MSKATSAELEKYATALKQALPAHKQEQTFRAAVEAGYLCALADGVADDEERATIARSIGELSRQAVLDWEVTQLIDEATDRVRKDGAEKRAEAVGRQLQELGQADAGLFIAALVALASGGLQKSEAVLIESVGKAAGVGKDAVVAVVKRARAAVKV